MPDILKQRTTAYVILTTLIAAGLGIGLLVWTANDSSWAANSSWRALWQDIGGLLFASVAISLLWEFGAKRSFLDEIFAKAELAVEVRDAGLVGITDDFQYGVPWETLFAQATSIDIFFAYGETWRNAHHNHLQKFLSNKKATLNVYLPATDDADSIAEMSRRFAYPEEDVIRRIDRSRQAFSELQTTGGGKVKVQAVYGCVPLCSIYIFDDIAIVVPYSHRKERCSVPALTFRKPSPLYNFARNEIDAVSKMLAMQKVEAVS